MGRRRRRASLPLALLLACGRGDDVSTSAGETSTGTSTTTPGTSTSTSSSTSSASETSSTTDGEAGLVCPAPFWKEADDLPDPAPECACVQGGVECEGPICPPITATCLHDSYGLCVDWKYDEAAIECALVALRDGTPGSVRWTFSSLDGIRTQSGSLYISTDRRALRRDSYTEDLDWGVSDTAVWQLQEPDFFASCLLHVDPCARLECIYSATLTTIALCEPGESS